MRGWAKTNPDGSVVTTSEKVLKQLALKVEDVVRDIQMQNGSAKTSDPWEPLPLDLVSQERPTLPRLCFTLEIAQADQVKVHGLKRLKIEFTGMQDLKFIVLGETLSCKRNIKEQNVYASGESIKLGRDESLEYLVQIKENIFVKEDKTKNCQNYPNAKYDSYDKCDEEFIKEQV